MLLSILCIPYIDTMYTIHTYVYLHICIPYIYVWYLIYFGMIALSFVLEMFNVHSIWFNSDLCKIFSFVTLLYEFFFCLRTVWGHFTQVSNILFVNLSDWLIYQFVYRYGRDSARGRQMESLRYWNRRHNKYFRPKTGITPPLYKNMHFGTQVLK